MAFGVVGGVATISNPGPTGPLGPIGPQGVEGPPGQIGPPGPQGFDGLRGDQGPSGPPGLQGIPGAQGPRGHQGLTGNEGPRGQTGPQGADGPQGVEGPQGVPGPPGSITEVRGDFGRQRFPDALPLNGFIPIDWDGNNNPPIAYQMATGQSLVYSLGDSAHPFHGHVYQFVGAAYGGWIDLGPISGPQGVRGEQGPPGPQGIPGVIGQSGGQGIQGPPGTHGAPGAQGPVGPAGATGPTGATGATGPQGPQGVKGDQGNQGPMGPQGRPGINDVNGIPDGGTAGEPLVKQSGIDYDADWDARPLKIAGIAANFQPFIQFENGSNRRVILDEINGIPKTGGTLVGTLQIDLSDRNQNSLRILNTPSVITAIYVGGAGDVSIQGGSYYTMADGQGFGVGFGGRFYKASGTGVVIRKSSGNQQPQIEENNGTNRRDIIDTVNGDLRYARIGGASGVMVSAAVSTCIDLSARFTRIWSQGLDPGIGNNPPILRPNSNGIYQSDANWTSTLYLPPANYLGNGEPFFFTSDATLITTIRHERTSMSGPITIGSGFTAVFIRNAQANLWDYVGTVHNTMLQTPTQFNSLGNSYTMPWNRGNPGQWLATNGTGGTNWTGGVDDPTSLETKVAELEAKIQELETRLAQTIRS